MLMTMNSCSSAKCFYIIGVTLGTTVCITSCVLPCIIITAIIKKRRHAVSVFDDIADCRNQISTMEPVYDTIDPMYEVRTEMEFEGKGMTENAAYIKVHTLI